MSKQNKMMKKSVLPFALVCSALMLSPYVGGQAHAEVQNVQQAKAVKGTVVDETGEPVIGATVLVVGGSASQGTITDMVQHCQTGAIRRSPVRQRGHDVRALRCDRMGF